MEHSNTSNSWNGSYDENNINFWFDNFKLFCSANGCYFDKEASIMYVFALIIICISLLLILVVIYLLSSLVRKDHGAPVYIINLLISDIIQLLCMIVWVAANENYSVTDIFDYLYLYGLLSSVGFMVCISLERYLVIAWPLWYRFKRTIKTSVVVSVLVWIIPLVYILPSYFWIHFEITETIFAVLLLLPLPLFIFFLGGTLKALSTSLSVSSDEKRRIVSVLVVVLLIYTLLFLPTVIWILVDEIISYHFWFACDILLLLSPLADLILYIFIRKGTTDKLLASLCCCRMQFRNQLMNSMNNDSMYTISFR